MNISMHHNPGSGYLNVGGPTPRGAISAPLPQELLVGPWRHGPMPPDTLGPNQGAIQLLSRPNPDGSHSPVLALATGLPFAARDKLREAGYPNECSATATTSRDWFAYMGEQAGWLVVGWRRCSVAQAPELLQAAWAQGSF
jgi:hypothetical protein